MMQYKAATTAPLPGTSSKTPNLRTQMLFGKGSGQINFNTGMKGVTNVDGGIGKVAGL